MFSFGLYPNVYAVGKLAGLRHMLERVWVHTHTPGDGTIYVVSGFGNYNGGARFFKTFTEHVEAGGVIVALFGGSTSQRLTSRQLVEALLECGARVLIVNRKRILHAKLYGVHAAKRSSLVVSSGNFTGPGLAQNVEASILVEDPQLSQGGFEWTTMFDAVRAQPWLFYEPDAATAASPAWKLLYDETPGAVKMDDSEEVTMIVRLGHADTARIQAVRGTPAAKGTQYFWLSKDCFDFFPPLTIRNARGIKGTLSAKVDLEYVDLAITKNVTVTFEAENNLDFRLGTGALRYTKVAQEGDLACLTRLSETKYQLRIVPRGDPNFNVLDQVAVSFVGHQGKRYGFVPNDQFSALTGIQLP